MASLYDRVSKGTISIDEIKASMERATSVGGQFYQSMDKQSQTLNGQISTLKDNFNEFLGNAIRPISDFLRDHLIPALNDILTGGENIKKFIEEHKTAITVIIGVIGSLTAAIIAYTVANNFAAIALGVYTTATTIATAVSTAFGAVMAFITSPITLVVLAIGALITIIVLLVQNWDTVKEKTLEIWNKIKEFLGNIINGIIEWFKELPIKIGIFISELLGKIIQFGTNAKDWVTNKLPEIINNIVEWFKQLPSRIWNVLVSALNSMLQWFGNMKSKASEGAKNTVQNIINAFSNLPGKMIEIGSNVVKGIWNGISNVTNWLFNKIKGFKDAVLNKFKSFFGIQSPSKLFRDELGKYMALGIGVGFEKNISKAYSDMQDAVDYETQKLGASVTANSVVDVERNANITATLNSIDNDKEVTVNAITNLDGKVLTSTVNKVNMKQKLAYGLA